MSHPARVVEVDTTAVDHAAHHAHVDLAGPRPTSPPGGDYTACPPNRLQPRTRHTRTAPLTAATSPTRLVLAGRRDRYGMRAGMLQPSR